MKFQSHRNNSQINFEIKIHHCGLQTAYSQTGFSFLRNACIPISP